MAHCAKICRSSFVALVVFVAAFYSADVSISKIEFHAELSPERKEIFFFKLKRETGLVNFYISVFSLFIENRSTLYCFVFNL